MMEEAARGDWAGSGSDSSASSDTSSSASYYSDGDDLMSDAVHVSAAEVEPNVQPMSISLGTALSLSPLPHDGYDDDRHQERAVARATVMRMVGHALEADSDASWNAPTLQPPMPPDPPESPAAGPQTHQQPRLYGRCSNHVLPGTPGLRPEHHLARHYAAVLACEVPARQEGTAEQEPRRPSMGFTLLPPAGSPHHGYTSRAQLTQAMEALVLATPEHERTWRQQVDGAGRRGLNSTTAVRFALDLDLVLVGNPAELVTAANAKRATAGRPRRWSQRQAVHGGLAAPLAPGLLALVWWALRDVVRVGASPSNNKGDAEGASRLDASRHLLLAVTPGDAKMSAHMYVGGGPVLCDQPAQGAGAWTHGGKAVARAVVRRLDDLARELHQRHTDDAGAHALAVALVEDAADAVDTAIYSAGRQLRLPYNHKSGRHAAHVINGLQPDTALAHDAAVCAGRPWADAVRMDVERALGALGLLSGPPSEAGGGLCTVRGLGDFVLSACLRPGIDWQPERDVMRVAPPYAAAAMPAAVGRSRPGSGGGGGAGPSAGAAASTPQPDHDGLAGSVMARVNERLPDVARCFVLRPPAVAVQCGGGSQQRWRVDLDRAPGVDRWWCPACERQHGDHSFVLVSRDASGQLCAEWRCRKGSTLLPGFGLNGPGDGQPAQRQQQQQQAFGQERWPDGARPDDVGDESWMDPAEAHREVLLLVHVCCDWLAGALRNGGDGNDDDDDDDAGAGAAMARPNNGNGNNGPGEAAEQRLRWHDATCRGRALAWLHEQLVRYVNRYMAIVSSEGRTAYVIKQCHVDSDSDTGVVERKGPRLQWKALAGLKEWLAACNVPIAWATKRGQPSVGKWQPLVEWWRTHADAGRFVDVLMAERRDGEAYAELLAHHLNLWRGFAVAPDAAAGMAEVRPFVRHMLWWAHAEVKPLVRRAANVDDPAWRQRLQHMLLYPLWWMAHKVQHPLQRMITAVLAQGGQGVGKSMVWKLVGSLFHRDNYAECSLADLVGPFNGALLEGAVLTLVDEAGFERGRANELKRLMTAHSVTINRKHLPKRQATPHFGLAMCCNDALAQRVEADERRLVVYYVDPPLWCPPDDEQQRCVTMTAGQPVEPLPEEAAKRLYFDALLAVPRPALLHLLRTLDLSGGGGQSPWSGWHVQLTLGRRTVEVPLEPCGGARFQPRHLPRTSSQRLQMLAHLDLVARWWKEGLDEGTGLSAGPHGLPWAPNGAPSAVGPPQQQQGGGEQQQGAMLYRLPWGQPVARREVLFQAYGQWAAAHGRAGCAFNEVLFWRRVRELCGGRVPRWQPRNRPGSVDVQLRRGNGIRLPALAPARAAFARHAHTDVGTLFGGGGGGGGSAAAGPDVANDDDDDDVDAPMRMELVWRGPPAE